MFNWLEMINVDKHTNVDTTIVSICSKILEGLKIGQTKTFDKLKDEINQILGEDADYNFLYSLDLLFLLGIVEYDLENNLIVRL